MTQLELSVYLSQFPTKVGNSPGMRRRHAKARLMLITKFPECFLRERLGRHVRWKWGAVVTLLLEVLDGASIPVLLTILPHICSQFQHCRSG